MPKLYLDTDLLTTYLKANLASELLSLGLDLRTSQIVDAEMLHDLTPQDVREAYVAFKSQVGSQFIEQAIESYPGEFTGPGKGERSLLQRYNASMAEGIPSIIASDDHKVRTWSGADGEGVNRVNTAELLDLHHGLNSDDAKYLDMRDAILSTGRIGNNNIQVERAGYSPDANTHQVFKTDLSLGFEHGRTPDGVEYYRRTSEPRPSGFISDVEARQKAHIDPLRLDDIAEQRAAQAAIEGDPASYDADGRLTPAAIQALEQIHAAGVALGAALTAYDIARTLTDVLPHWRSGDYDYVVTELTALAMRNSAGWAAGLLGLQLGAELGAVGGPWGALIGGLIGGLAFGFLGEELGDELGRALGDLINGLGRYFEDNPATHWLGDLFGFSFGARDPLVFDLDGNGVQLLALASSSAYFDLDGDGAAERTGWVSPGDGLLVRDLNGNGQIDNGSELFGNAELDGFAILRQSDTNQDGVIDASDAIFADLRIWQDTNGDGVSQAGELSTLQDRGIISISLSTIDGGADRAGNAVILAGTLLTSEGSIRESIAVAFSTDQINTRYQLPEDFVYDPDVIALPNLRGYGEVPDLWVAMTLDPVLKQMVLDLVAGTKAGTGLQDLVGQFEVRNVSGTGGVVFPYFDYDMQAFDDMLARWTGVATSDDERVQAENIAEAFMNRQADHAINNPNFYQAFEKFSTQLAVRFFAQVPKLDSYRAMLDLAEALKSAVPANGLTFTQAEIDTLLAPVETWLASRPALPASLEAYAGLDYDFSRDAIGGDLAGFIDEQLVSFDFNPNNPWDGYDAWYAERQYVLQAVDPSGAVLDERLRAHTGNATLAMLKDPFLEFAGTTGDDTIDGSNLTTQGDLIIGGAGNDLLRGGAGNDGYVFADGCGNDTVIDVSGIDEIAFRGSLTSSLARYAFANGNRDDLLITFEGRSESVTIIGYFAAGGRPSIEAITFPDGPRASNAFIRDYVLSTLATEGSDEISGYDLDERLSGLGGDDVIDGGDGNDVLAGDAGDDELIGNLGNDRLDGGVGNDALRGGGGDDVYAFAPGGGQDVFGDSLGEANQGGIDVVVLGPGITAEDIIVEQGDTGRDLILKIDGTTDQITLDDTSVDGWHRIERVAFDDGTTLTFEQLLALATTATEGNDFFYGSYQNDTLAGAGGNDTLITGEGNDTLNGGAGNDLLQGGRGDDTYLLEAGFGQDVVRDSNGLLDQGGFDTIQFGTGITSANIIVTQGDSGNDLIITVNGTTDQVTLDNTSADGWAQIERVRFADGTVLTHAALLAMAVTPTAGNDTFYGSTENDPLAGGGGDDTLIGKHGNDTLAGGTGNDLLQGGRDDDTYVFESGFGQDIVRDANGLLDQGGFDTIQFGTGITANGITVTQADNGNDLVITINGTGDQITLDNTSADGYARIEQVRFADGSTLSHNALMELATGATPGPDSFTGSSASDRLFGGGGNDTLYGKGGNDRLEGGVDNDVLIGGGGDDTYYFEPGFGQDVVSDPNGLLDQGGYDRISFGLGISVSDLTVVQADSGRDLVIKINGTTDQITLNDTLSNGYAMIEEVRFHDGTVLTHSQLMGLATAPTPGDDLFYGSTVDDTLSGGGGNDTLVAAASNDSLTGGTGNDLLVGGSGDDTYYFGPGFGQDIVRDANGSFDQGGFDRIQFGAGIAAADIIVIQADNGGDLIIKLNGTDDQIILDNTVSNGWAQIEQVRFDNGTTLSHADLVALATQSRPTGDSYWGDDAANSLAGGGGNDTIYGRGGNDSLAGDDGNDSLYGENGDDTLSGGAGDDTLMVDGGTDILDGGDGIDTVGAASAGAIIVDLRQNSANANFGGGLVETWANVENINAGSGNDALTGSAIANQLNGGSGNDQLVGLGGDDRLEGGAGHDALYGDSVAGQAAAVGNNLLINASFETSGTVTWSNYWVKVNSNLPGWAKANSQSFEQVYSGWAGFYATHGSYWLDLDAGGGAGSNMDISQTVTGLSAGQAMLLQFDHANPTSAASGSFEVYWNGTLVAAINETGANFRAKAYELVAVAGDNVLRILGTGTADNTGAYIDNVRLYAAAATGTGSDTLIGGDGNDLLVGGAQADNLSGGGGADVFKFAAGDTGLGTGADQILDFSSGSDKIDLAQIDANVALSGDQAFTFIGNASFGGVAGQLRYTANGANGLLQMDTNGDSVADMEIILVGAPSLVAADLIL